MADRKASTAAEAWRRLLDFILLTAGHRDVLLERLALTPGDGRVLMSLAREDGRPMRTLADEWDCDPSTATWMVDRLERRQFVERRPMPGDRRVKLVLLTARGLKIKSELLAGLYEPPTELLTLSREDLEALRDASTKLPSHPTPSPAPRKTPRRTRSSRGPTTT